MDIRNKNKARFFEVKDIVNKNADLLVYVFKSNSEEITQI